MHRNGQARDPKEENRLACALSLEFSRLGMRPLELSVGSLGLGEAACRGVELASRPDRGGKPERSGSPVCIRRPVRAGDPGIGLTLPYLERGDPGPHSNFLLLTQISRPSPAITNQATAGARPLPFGRSNTPWDRGPQII